METKLNKKTMKSYVITLLAMIMGINPITYGYEYSDYTWYEYNGHLYAITLEHSNWAQAEAWANEVGGHLVQVDDMEENAWLSSTFKGHYVRSAPGNTWGSLVWIGLEYTGGDKRDHTSWQWSTGEPLSFNPRWWINPNNYVGVYAYLHTDTHPNPGTWLNHAPHDQNPAANPKGIIEIDVEPYLVVEVDIKPGSCPNPLNVKDKGVLPVAVLGSEDFEVFNIDPASIRLEGVAPIRSSYEDVATPVSDKTDDCDCTIEGPNGFFDLVLKFNAQEIVAALGAVYDGDNLVLTLTGETHDGTPLEGTDCVVIIAKK